MTTSKYLMTILTLACMLPCAGKYRVSCLTAVKAEEGADVTLRCHLDPQVDLHRETADWQRNNDIVHVYRDQQDNPKPQSARYKGRTSLSHEDLLRGDLTLNISAVTPEDSGPYTCFVPHLTVLCATELTVETRGQENKTSQGITSPGEVAKISNTDVLPGGENRKDDGVISAAVVSFWFVVTITIVVLVLVVF